MELRCSECGYKGFDARLEVGVKGHAVILCCLKCARYVSFTAPELKQVDHEASYEVAKYGVV